ncbi:hypothetical protein CMV30_03120 [Nibricoccus aquaticus]|uniref:Uncharacterized protein n=1 Tax=Nibricoccus aquaticus TaxID=2576891 RepID=A0A290Q2Z0_9BACT|nr:hypothetical protein CMV30_03120 [Nibricoccus aquaticus]
MVIGHWSLVIGHWSLVIGHWSLVIGHWSLVIGHWSLVIGHWSLRRALRAPPSSLSPFPTPLPRCPRNEQSSHRVTRRLGRPRGREP